MNCAPVLPSTPSSPGRRYAQSHCFPITSISVASSGTLMKSFQTKRPGVSMATMPTVVMPVSHHSSFLFSGSYAARRPSWWRNFNTQ